MKSKMLNASIYLLLLLVPGVAWASEAATPEKAMEPTVEATESASMVEKTTEEPSLGPAAVVALDAGLPGLPLEKAALTGPLCPAQCATPLFGLTFLGITNCWLPNGDVISCRSYGTPPYYTDRCVIYCNY